MFLSSAAQCVDVGFVGLAVALFSALARHLPNT